MKLSNYDGDMTDPSFFFCFCARAHQKMMEFFNGQERTVTYLRDLLGQAGWKLIAVHNDEPSARRYQKAIAVPI
jgi:hypothetical protein